MISATDLLAAKILIVDDQAANVGLLEQMLAAAGHSDVSSTMNPLEVCELHSRHRYDLILLDLQMPRMNGFAVLEALKAASPDDQVPVLVITAQPAHKLRALQAGAKDFVAKPFDLVEVRTRIRNLLEVRLLHRALADYNRRLEQTVLERTAELRASEERFQRLTELSSDWYWEQDAGGRFTQVSGPALEMLHLRREGSELSVLEAHIAARRPFLDVVYARINADGSEQVFQVSGEPMFDASGCYTGFRGVGVDVTGRTRPA